MKRTLFHLALGSLVVTASLGAGFVRSSIIAKKTRQLACGKKSPPAPVVSESWKPVVEKYAGGVCLLAGTVSYVDEAGKPVRYDVKAFEERGELVPNPDGPVFSHDFAGTAFHIGNGVVLTNEEVFNDKGVSHFWVSQPHTQVIDRQVVLGFTVDQGITIGKQRVTESFSNVRAYFPNQPEPFHLKAGGLRLVHNVPEFTFELNGADVPALKVYDNDDRMISTLLRNDRVGQKLLLLWQPVFQETDASRQVKPTIGETSIGWNWGHNFLMNNFRDGQIPPPGAPILDEQGVVIGIIGFRNDPSWRVESDFDARGIMSREPILMGETYGAHLYNRKAGFPCDCESEKSAKKSRHRR